MLGRVSDAVRARDPRESVVNGDSYLAQSGLPEGQRRRLATLTGPVVVWAGTGPSERLGACEVPRASGPRELERVCLNYAASQMSPKREAQRDPPRFASRASSRASPLPPPLSLSPLSLSPSLPLPRQRLSAP